MNWKKIEKIDLHTHITLRKMIGSDIKLNPPERFLTVMDQHNISRAVVVPINFPYYHAKRSMGENYEAILRFNNDRQGEIAGISDRFICFADIDLYALPLKTVLQELERAIDQIGLRGIKIHPFNQGLKGDDPKIEVVLRFAQGRDLPVVIHSYVYPGRPHTAGTSPKYIVNLLERVPHKRVVVAHMGGIDHHYLKGVDCFFDISAYLPMADHTPEELGEIIRGLGVERCCFATDYRVNSYNQYYKILNRIDFTPEEVAQIARLNGECFLGF